MTTRCIAALLFACVLTFTAQAQRSIADLVNEANADWMFGRWQAQSESGEPVTLNVSWDLDKHVVVLHVNAGSVEAKGYTVLEPKAEFPKYYSFDTKGSVGKGSWNMENGELVLRVESESPERAPWKAAFVFTGNASTGLQVRMHTIESSGDLATPARVTYKFKKK